MVTGPLMLMTGTALLFGVMLLLLPFGGLHGTADLTDPTAPPIRPAAALPASTSHGLVRFTVRTPGARVVVRRADVKGAAEQRVTSKAMRLPVGQWVASASAPGFLTWTTRFNVKAASPVNLLIRLRPATRMEAGRRRLDSEKRHLRNRRAS